MTGNPPPPEDEAGNAQPPLRGFILYCLAGIVGVPTFNAVALSTFARTDDFWRFFLFFTALMLPGPTIALGLAIREVMRRRRAR